MPDFVIFDDVSDAKAAEQYAVRASGGVSTLTHSTAFVARHFLQWREKQRLGEVVKRISKERSPKKSNGGLREAALQCYMNGMSPKEVSVELDITYANAHYYSRLHKVNAK